MIKFGSIDGFELLKVKIIDGIMITNIIGKKIDSIKLKSVPIDLSLRLGIGK